MKQVDKDFILKELHKCQDTIDRISGKISFWANKRHLKERIDRLIDHVENDIIGEDIKDDYPPGHCLRFDSVAAMRKWLDDDEKRRRKGKDLTMTVETKSLIFTALFAMVMASMLTYCVARDGNTKQADSVPAVDAVSRDYEIIAYLPQGNVARVYDGDVTCYVYSRGGIHCIQEWPSVTEEDDWTDCAGEGCQ